MGTSQLSQPLTRLVHENLSIVMCYAYSVGPLQTMFGEHFTGDWKYLRKSLFEVSAVRAEKACLELALFLRLVVESEGLAKLEDIGSMDTSCGRLYLESGEEKPLTFLDSSNKIIHAHKIDWGIGVFDPGEEKPVNFSPTIRTFPGDHPAWIAKEKRWKEANIDLVPFAALCGQLAH